MREGSHRLTVHLKRPLAAFLLFVLSFLVAPSAMAAQTFEDGLSLYHQGNLEAAFNVFRDLHQSHPTGTGKLLYFMALSSNRLHRHHEALKYLDAAIQANPSLSFARNKAHVEALRSRLVRETSQFSPDASRNQLMPQSSPLSTLSPEPSHGGHSTLMIAIIVVFAIALLIFVAGRLGEKKKSELQNRTKRQMEETGARLIAAIDKLREEKSYYLLDHPDQKNLLEKAFSNLDTSYVRVLTIMKEADTQGTDWEDRSRRFESALAPVDEAIRQIRFIMEPGSASLPPSGEVPAAPSVNMNPNAENQPLTGGSDPSKCIFDGNDATNGRTISLERDGKVAFVRVCPKCLSEMENNYQKTGNYAPPQNAFAGGGMGFMGGGMGFGDMMLMDWMMHSGERPEVNNYYQSPESGAWQGGDDHGREDRTGSIGEANDRS
ncbi:MAG: tetratricopeptide repeat protein [Leptospirillum sp.]